MTISPTNALSPPGWSKRIYARVNRREIAYVRFIIEAHGHLALVSVVDKYQAVVRFLFSPDQEMEVREVLHGLSEEIGLEVIDLPDTFGIQSSKSEGKGRVEG